MKVLFVSSGNRKTGPSPIIKNQGESLKEKGVDVVYFTIKGKGFFGYLKNILPLRKQIKRNNYNLIHSHYSLSAMTVLLTLTHKPVVLSFMGDDLLGSQNSKGKYTFGGKFGVALSLLIARNVSSRIVKSEEMGSIINDCEIIPNGVDYNKFFPYDKGNACKFLGLDIDKTYILFPANPNRPEKNYELFQKSVASIFSHNITPLFFDNIPSERTLYYYNVSSVVVLTSYHEGSPNVIKEAMACNIPVVSTDVGDVKDVIGKTDGCYITTFDPRDVTDKIRKALKFGKKTTGREDIKHLEAGVVAKRIIEVYRKVLEKK